MPPEDSSVDDVQEDKPEEVQSNDMVSEGSPSEPLRHEEVAEELGKSHDRFPLRTPPPRRKSAVEGESSMLPPGEDHPVRPTFSAGRPISGKSPCKIPPDHEVHGLAEVAEEYWHLPRSVWDRINSRVTGKGIVIASLDTGYNPHHELIPKPLVARSFVDSTAAIDGHGHGSHTIGTCCGRSPLISPAFEADLIVGKVLRNDGSGPSSAIAEGIRWAVDAGANIISMSLGGSAAYPPTQAALQYAEQNGVVVVAAAGNSGYEGANSIGYPGKFIETLCIGATKKDGSIASFSSGGRQLDLATPGQEIVSCAYNHGQKLVRMSGTSMATPFAAALCALVLQLALREGKPWWKGTDAWREFLGQFMDDRGTPGDDPRFGMGVPKYQEIVTALINDDLKWV